MCNEKKNIKFLDVAELPEMEIPDMVGIIEKGILPVKGRMIIAGPPKSCKSLMALYLGQALANCTSWLGFTVQKKSKVLTIQAELSSASLKMRVVEMKIKTVKGDFLISPPIRNLDIRKPDDLKRLSEWIKEIYPDVVIIDPLVNFFSGNENEVGDMMDCLKKLDKVLGNQSIILVHHTKKPTRKYESARELVRGSSALAGWADTLIVLKSSGKGTIYIDFILRDGEPLPNMTLTLKTDPLRFEETGKRHTVIDWKSIFKNDETLNASALYKRCSETSGWSNKTAERKVKEAIENKELFSHKEGRENIFTLKPNLEAGGE